MDPFEIDANAEAVTVRFQLGPMLRAAGRPLWETTTRRLESSEVLAVPLSKDEAMDLARRLAEEVGRYDELTRPAPPDAPRDEAVGAGSEFDWDAWLRKQPAGVGC